MRKFVMPLACLVVVASGLAALRIVRAPEARASGPVEWPMSSKDVLAWEGIDAQVAALDREVAPIVTDTRVRAAIFQCVMRLQWKADELAAEVSREKGVAVVRSGSTWVTRR